MKRRIGCCAAVRGTMNRTTFAAPTATGSRLSFSSTSSGFALCFRGLLSPFALFALFAFCRGTGAMPLSKIFFEGIVPSGTRRASPADSPAGTMRRAIRRQFAFPSGFPPINWQAIGEPDVETSGSMPQEGVRHFQKRLTPFTIREIFLDKKDNKLYFYISAQRKQKTFKRRREP